MSVMIVVIAMNVVMMMRYYYVVVYVVCVILKNLFHKINYGCGPPLTPQIPPGHRPHLFQTINISDIRIRNL